MGCKHTKKTNLVFGAIVASDYLQKMPPRNRLEPWPSCARFLGTHDHVPFVHVVIIIFSFRFISFRFIYQVFFLWYSWTGFRYYQSGDCWSLWRPGKWGGGTTLACRLSRGSEDAGTRRKSSTTFARTSESPGEDKLYMYDYHTPVLVPGAKKWKNEKLERRKERQKMD